jgi:rare lipoprotein A
VRKGAALAAASALALGACAHAPSLREAPVAQGEVGLASFYGRAFQGQLTASGARYDRRAMTCAHRWLPFGSVARVTDLDTQRSVEVVVIDRGPHVRGRIVDLSLAAAEALGIVERGVARVRVVRVR